MKILSSQNLKKLDSHTLQQQNISSTELMLRAASKCFDWIENNLGLNHTFSVVCGPGNNGGDGLVIAQLLSSKNCDIECIVLDFTNQHTSDYDINLTQLQQTNCTIHTINSDKDLENLTFKGRIIIDAIFGIGLNRPAEGVPASVIQKINTVQSAKIIAIDLPSGLLCDELNAAKDVIIQADYTLTFHVPKFSFFFPEGGNSVGKVEVLDIHLDKSFASNLESSYYYISASKVAKFLNKRKTFTHKGTYGHANLIVGSRGKMGAAILSSKAASSVGTGLVTATIPTIGLTSMQTCVPVAMCNDNYGENTLEGQFIIDEKQTYGIGPGIGKEDKTIAFLGQFLKQVEQPIVMDADAINIVAQSTEMLNDIPENSILTPHIKEFDRLTGESKNSSERLRKLIDFCSINKLFVVLKDARTIISTPKGECYFSLNGSPGMATGGSGDVLTGILTGFLAQGYSPEQTAQLGVIFHGIAGELAAKKNTELAMTATSIIEEIKNAALLIHLTSNLSNV